MTSAQIFVLVLLLELAVFEAGFSQQECQAQVVVTSQAELKDQIRAEITNAFQSYSGVANASRTAPTVPTATEGLTEQAVARIEGKLHAIYQKLDSLERKMPKPTLCHAASSCAEILENDPASLSGYYWVNNGTGHPHSVYCDMTRSCGGVTGGWMRVAYLVMTNSSHQCPNGFRQRIDSGVRSCVLNSDLPYCSRTPYTTQGISYSSVCGKIHGYEIGTPDGFHNTLIDYHYVDGVSLTHGSPRKHIWSFAAGPCPDSILLPGYVKNDYFYDGSSHDTAGPINLGNPLWDGEDCGNNTCCRHKNPPWFHKQLPRPTTDDIEMRVCRNEHRHLEDVAIQVVEIYVI